MSTSLHPQAGGSPPVITRTAALVALRRLKGPNRLTWRLRALLSRSEGTERESTPVLADGGARDRRCPLRRLPAGAAAQRGLHPLGDLRWDCMSVAGHSFLKTPNIDRLATEGIRFSNGLHRQVAHGRGEWSYMHYPNREGAARHRDGRAVQRSARSQAEGQSHRRAPKPRQPWPD